MPNSRRKWIIIMYFIIFRVATVRYGAGPGTRTVLQSKSSSPVTKRAGDEKLRSIALWCCAMIIYWHMLVAIWLAGTVVRRYCYILFNFKNIACKGAELNAALRIITIGYQNNFDIIVPSFGNLNPQLFLSSRPCATTSSQ